MTFRRIFQQYMMGGSSAVFKSNLVTRDRSSTSERQIHRNPVKALHKQHKTGNKKRIIPDIAQPILRWHQASLFAQVYYRFHSQASASTLEAVGAALEPRGQAAHKLHNSKHTDEVINPCT